MTTSEPSPFLLTPIDSRCPRDYVPTTLFFPESPGSDVSAVAATFRNGLSRTFQAIIQLSGTVQGCGQRGELCVTGPWRTVDEVFQVQDLRHDEALDYRQLRDRSFPLKDIDSRFLPLAGMKKRVKTVMLVQLNIIKGGMVMGLCLHHNFTDASGIFAIAKVWAACCRGEDGSQLLTREMIDRERLMQGWGKATIDDFPGWQMRPVEEKAPSPGIVLELFNRIWGSLRAHFYKWKGRATTKADTATPRTEAAVFFFSTSKLRGLKSMASSSEHEKNDDVWISTQDALCALIRCCAHSARDEKIRKMPDKTCSTFIALGFRSKLDPPLPADYIGNCTYFIPTFLPSQCIDSTPAKVGELAHLIRDQIKQCDDSSVGKRIAALTRVADLARVVVTPVAPSEDRLLFSSWSSQKFYDINWGDVVGAKIERVRNPSRAKLCVILPELKGPGFAEEERGLEVLIELEKGQMGRLKQNELFMRFAEWRCS